MSAALYIVCCMETRGEIFGHGRRCDGRAVGPTLSALRLEAGLTQAVLARKLGTTQSAVARMESGKSRPSLESVRRVASALGCDFSLVFDRSVAGI